MARRTLAVFLACLFTQGLVPGIAFADRDCRAGAARGGDPDPAEIARVNVELRERLASRTVAAEIKVPMWVHVLTDGQRGAPDAAVKSQVATLNSAYGGKFGGADTGIRFVLLGITRTRNADWFRDPLSYEQPMKTKLRRGGANTLNLFIGQLSQLVLGYSTYPHWYKDAPGYDGVVIDWRSLPGGALRNFNRGFTGVHEIGHWLGLLHPFENGCEAPGDSVEDTPPQGHPTEGCPTAVKDTCPAPGVDSVHNFMDYSFDTCMSEFTAGQAERMRQMWTAYRIPKA
ncbi:zinc metalloprotease [Acrocarpospora macrocephala]|uniref:Zinc metalloprotease n=1 Tax=Acrocarpospora macrocephala TaxID=150177 RepID=A0A5M3WN33_9ACTN|nr:zinc metalloprotease [Acrocarpospora macrocephala]